MADIQMTLEIAPVAWQRVKRGRSGHAYVPTKTRDFKAAIGILGKAKYNRPPLNCPIKVSAIFYLNKPKKGLFPHHPAVIPDLDNYVKALCDGLNGVLWTDDSRICSFSVSKRYVDVNGPVKHPQIDLWVEELKV